MLNGITLYRLNCYDNNMSAYGIPYKGGKSKVVKWVIDSLPPAEHFYDLFCGGCAVTHYGMILTGSRGGMR